MIPKVIHYCWFGGGEKPKSFQRCVDSWKEHCPDFRIREWNEETSKPYMHQIAKDALRKKQYAFAADAVRIRVLYELGGIYLDTDMLVLRPLDDLLQYDFFTGYEVPGRPAYGLFGAVPGHGLIEMMDVFYKNERFNEFSPPVITHTFKDLIVPENLGPKDRILQPQAFYSLPYEQREKNYREFVNEQAYAVHLWDHSWKTASAENIGQLFRNLYTVMADTLVYNYPRSYFRRYSREFGRKIYQRIFKKH